MEVLLGSLFQNQEELIVLDFIAMRLPSFDAQVNEKLNFGFLI
jgi:hypothetical protein